MSSPIQHLAELSESFAIDDNTTRQSLMQFHARLLASPWQRTSATTSPSLRSLLKARKKKKKKKKIEFAVSKNRTTVQIPGLAVDERVLRSLSDERAAAALIASVVQLASLLPSNGLIKSAASVSAPRLGVTAAPVVDASSATARSCETVLVRELLFVFQGLDGDVLRFDAASRHFLLAPPVGDVRFADLSVSVRALTMRLCEVGRSFRRVDLFLRRVDAAAPAGVVLQALAAGVRDELTAFKRAVAALEPHRKSLTLRRLYAWSLGPAERLRWLAALVGGVKDARGGALLRLVAQYAAHGDAQVRALVLSLVEQMSHPLRVMTRAWVLRGSLTAEARDEFFVYDRFVREPATLDVGDAGEPRSLWADRFQLADELLPPAELLSADDARLALLLGKSINFLQSACADHDVIATVATAARDDAASSTICARRCAPPPAS
jgi:hypothetical protein